MRNFNPFNLNKNHSQRGVGLVRPRLYTLRELSEELNTPFGVLTRLVNKYQIQPGFKKESGPKQYRIADFQSALNKEKNMNFKIEKGVPLPDQKTRSQEYQEALKDMAVGDSIVIPHSERAIHVSAIKRAFPQWVILSRVLREDDTKVRIWRKA